VSEEKAARNFKLVLRYDGANYHGWQLQRGVPTIQGVLEEAIERVVGRQARVHASGRTDAGVHALGQVVHFKAETELPAQKLRTSLNEVLPEDIRVVSAEEVPVSFHSRYDASAKVYRYTILNCRIAGRYKAKSVHVFSPKLDLESMRKAAAYLLGTHDFSSFGVNPGWPVDNATRTIHRLELRRQGHYIFIEVEADGFLYKMVRSIVGTLIKVGAGKIEPGAMVEILESRDRTRAGATAPAHGLCLVEVKYPTHPKARQG
jgi:tRNA pseudouridine38-40 synthase